MPDYLIKQTNTKPEQTRYPNLQQFAKSDRVVFCLTPAKNSNSQQHELQGREQEEDKADYHSLVMQKTKTQSPDCLWFLNWEDLC